jgi:hypothetical protein
MLHWRDSGESRSSGRGRLYLRQTKEFAVAEPAVTAKLAAAKAVSFFFAGRDGRLGVDSAFVVGETRLES